MNPSSIERRAAGRVVAVCAGERTGAGKKSIGEGYLRQGHGLVGDAHAGRGVRPVSLVAVEDVEAVNRTKGLAASPGDFAANIAVAGLDLVGLPIGARLRVGQASLEITEIGKDPSLAHDFSFCGVSLLVERGVFCNVVENGEVSEGDSVEMLTLPNEGDSAR